MQPIIRVQNIGKQYRLGAKAAPANTLYESLRQTIATLHSAARTPEFWALQEVSFEVAPGEVVGIIGRNGAGKSTLLKILARITQPTCGAIDLYGRVGSLLEVGTGFHPDLTGRENIYLNGAILGMPRAEITRKFAEIVAFAEVEQFLDTPVKHYSSGMYTRLAFAVAAHLEPEILIVDEVLAVGDAEFQKRCLGKMREISQAGRTVLFVSHNLNAVEKLCDRAILLEQGRVTQISAQGSEAVRGVIRQYLAAGNATDSASEWQNAAAHFANDWFQPERLAVTDAQGHALAQPVSNDHDFYVLIEGEIDSHDPGLQIGYALYASNGQTENELLYWSNYTDQRPQAWPALQRGKNTLLCQIPRRFLNEGEYTIELIASLHFRQWILEPGVNAPRITFEIRGGLSDSPLWLSKRPGLIAPELAWHNLPAAQQLRVVNAEPPAPVRLTGTHGGTHGFGA